MKTVENGTNCRYNLNVELRNYTKMRCTSMSDLINENYISIEDAAMFLNIKSVTLRKWIKDKNIPAHKIGKQWKFKRSELEEWVKSGKSAME
jgi:excisionase family DNA binding protein